VVKKVKPAKESVLIEGLPGIGNVGKVAVDFIVDELKAEKVYEIVSQKLPNYVFVNEQNMVELPSIAVYHKKIKNRSIFIVAGDAQPADEASCHEFCNQILKICKKHNCKEIITLGGIGLKVEPKKPKIFCAANDKRVLEKYMKGKNRINGIIGPIIGVSGLLVGLAAQKRIPAVNILAETYGHPNYMGLKGAKELLNILENKLKLGLNLKKLNKELNNALTQEEEHSLDIIDEFDLVEEYEEEDLNYIG